MMNALNVQPTVTLLLPELLVVSASVDTTGLAVTTLQYSAQVREIKLKSRSSSINTYWNHTDHCPVCNIV